MTAEALARERVARAREDALRQQRRRDTGDSTPFKSKDAEEVQRKILAKPCSNEHLHRPWQVLQEGPCCLLAATSIAQRDPHLPRLVSDLSELLSVFSWARAVLNIFSQPAHAAKARLRNAFHAAHRHIVPSFIPGFKTLFWRSVLRPVALTAFTHLLLFDSDLVVSPRSFDLVGLLRVGEAANASLIQPSPYGSGPGLYGLGHPRCPESSACSCSPDPESQCVACRQPVIEVKVPLFRMPAWVAVYEHMLGLLPPNVLMGDKMMDLVWCGILDHRVHGACAPSLDPGDAQFECVVKVGMACAVSYATPIQHLNHRTIERDFVKWTRSNVTDPSPCIGGGCGLAKDRDEAAPDPMTSLTTVTSLVASGRERARHRSWMPPTPPPPPAPFPSGKSLHQTNELNAWMRRLGLLRYIKYPSWRPKFSLLDPQNGAANDDARPPNGGPCWSQTQMADALGVRPPVAYNGSRVVAGRMPPRIEWFGPEGGAGVGLERSELALLSRRWRAGLPLYPAVAAADTSTARDSSSIKAASAVVAPSGASLLTQLNSLAAAAVRAMPDDDLVEDDYRPAHGCEAVANEWCQQHCSGYGSSPYVPHGARSSEEGSPVPPVPPVPSRMLARHSQCHADECKRFNFAVLPTDWQCFPLSALTEDRRAVADWAGRSWRSPSAEALGLARASVSGLETASGVRATAAALIAMEDRLLSPSFCGELGRPMGVNWTHVDEAASQSAETLRAASVDTVALEKALLSSSLRVGGALPPSPSLAPPLTAVGAGGNGASKRKRLRQLASGFNTTLPGTWSQKPPSPHSAPLPTMAAPWVPRDSCARVFPRRLDGLSCRPLLPLPNVSDAASCQAACCARPPATTAEKQAAEAYLRGRARSLPDAQSGSSTSGCDVWQWCASPDHCNLPLPVPVIGGQQDASDEGKSLSRARCWIGAYASGCLERSHNTSGWITAVRTQTLGTDARGRSSHRTTESHRINQVLASCLREKRPDLLPREWTRKSRPPPPPPQPTPLTQKQQPAISVRSTATRPSQVTRSRAQVWRKAESRTP